MAEYKPRKSGKRVIAFLKEVNDWCSVRQVYTALGLRDNSVRRSLYRLVENKLVKKRRYMPPKIIFPDDWEELGRYCRRKWQRRNVDINDMHYRFQRQYEYRIVD